MKVIMLEERPDHFVMKEGDKTFRVPRLGLSVAMHERIRGMADGGRVLHRGDVVDIPEYEGKYPAMPRPKDAGRVTVKLGKLELKPHHDTAAEYEEETGSKYRPHAHEQPPHPSTLANITEFARKAAGAVGMADGGVAAENRYSSYNPYALPERRDAGPVVYVSSVPTPGAIPMALPRGSTSGAGGAGEEPRGVGGGGGGGPPDVGASAAGGGTSLVETAPGGGPGGPRRIDMGPMGAEGGPSGNEPRTISAPVRRELPPGVVPEVPPVPPPAKLPPQPPAPASARGTPMPTGLGSFREGVEAEQEAIRARGGYEAGQARELARVLSAQRQDMQAQAIEDKQLRDTARSEASAMMAQQREMLDEMRKTDTAVDPGRYWASRSTPQKVLGAIGLALGSIGAGQDGVNRAAQMLSTAIDRDIEAQKAEHAIRLQKGQQAFAAGQSLYAMNHAIFQDQLATNAAAKASALELVENQIQQVKATYGGPIAQQQLNQLLAVTKRTQGEFELKTFMAADEARHRMALERIAGAKAALSPTEQSKLLDVQTAADNIHRNIAKARAIVEESGTAEVFGHKQDVLKGALHEAAQDFARMVDPGGTVREGELANAKLRLGFKGGEWITPTNKTALKLLDDFENSIEERKQIAYKRRGLTPPQ